MTGLHYGIAADSSVEAALHDVLGFHKKVPVLRGTVSRHVVAVIRVEY